MDGAKLMTDTEPRSRVGRRPARAEAFLRRDVDRVGNENPGESRNRAA